VPLEAFERHLRWLVSGAVRVLSLDALLQAPAEHDAVALTFDDGFRNFGALAAPRLEAAGLPATVFVVSGHVGRTNAWGGVVTPGVPDLPLLDWDELDRLAGRGIDIGAHTRSHPDLTTLDAARARDELLGSADDIARRLGRRPVTFAYPFGATDEAVIAAAAGVFDVACTTEFALVATGSTRAALPRLDAFYFRDDDRLATFGTAGFERFVRRRGWLRRIRRRVLG
jgi:peptidoglycan/xylan/chitin deacetylase (PgdA/CDA1 family)